MQACLAPAKLMELSGSLTRSLKRFWTASRVYLRRAVTLHGNDSASATTPPQSNERMERADTPGGALGIELDDPADVLSRFLFQKGHFKRAENRAVPEAFMPPMDLQLSTFLTTGMAAANIWDVGKEVLASHPQPRLYGRADMDVGAVHSQKLKAVRDDNPDRHVSVVGWPTYSNGKDLIKIIAQELARSSRLTLLATPASK